MVNWLLGIPLGYIRRQSNKFNWGLPLWRQYMVGRGPGGKVDWMKFFIAVSSGKVKVGVVCRVMNTLFEFTLTGVCKDRLALPGWGGGGLKSLVQTDGLPVQVNPFKTLQLTHPGWGTAPASQVSPPRMMPSPHTDSQIPIEFTLYPGLHKTHCVPLLQLLQLAIQFAHFLTFASKYWALGHTVGSTGVF